MSASSPADRSTVTVLTAEAGKSHELSSQDEQELLAAMQGIDSGEFVSVEQVLETLRQHG